MTPLLDMAPDRDLLTLALLPGVGPRLGRALEARGLAEVLARPEPHADLLPDPAMEQLRSGAARRRADEEIERCARRGVRLLGRAEPDYPEALRSSCDAPAVLWVCGELDSSGPQLAIVGSRGATGAGSSLARGIARELAAAGVSIVSGLARGIDTAAHRGALDGSGRTVAVLGCGVDVPYPPENAELQAAIAERGAVISEFPLQTPPLPGHFPRRNRVIAGLCRAVLVVEAGLKSGALGTARLALDEGRDVFAVPGRPGDPLAEGTNQLLRDGAALVRHARDVADELGLELGPKPAKKLADPLLDALSTETPRSLSELQQRCGQEGPALLARLAELELLRQVRRLPGPLFVRA
jgi:DNA processing protein